ncbi:hypothetical protein CEE45_13620 [Candidatus Heimdallarchaeota archaeon B3_Heim]|nr:MAG: hypothetical protein CEE45_13620 [Candidatus Heimdallarchaeota archaeon B3_Heim]
MYLKKEHTLPLVFIGTLQFIILTFIAMIFYTGGTRIDETAQGYSFFTNFFSDLGRTVAYSGKGNLISVILFIVALVGLGLTFLSYFRFIPEIFNSTEEEQKLSKIVAKIGTVAAIAFIGIAFTPANLVTIIHDSLVVTGFTLVSIVLGILLILTIRDQKFSKVYTITYLILILIVLAYGGLFFLIPKIVTYEDLLIRVSMQKLVVYSLLACFLFQSFGIWRHRYQSSS